MDLFLALVGLAGSFFFAGTESAFTNFNRIRLAAWKREQKRFIKATDFFTEQPEDFFSTILIGNNFSSILYTTFITVVLIRFLDESVAWALLTVIIVYFGEIFPKTLFRMMADRIVRPSLTVVYAIYFLLKPLISVLNRFINLFLNLLGVRHKEVRDYFSREELHFLLHAGTDEPDEQKYISNILEFKTVKVREAMIPRAEVVAVKADSDWDTVVDVLSEYDLNFVMMYDDSIDNITGVLFAYELLNGDTDISERIRPVRFVPENKSCAALLREFQDENITVAVVVDEYGGTAGIVTLDDLVDEVFGEVEEEGQIRALNDHTWLLDARVELDMLEEQLGLDFGASEAETLAGFVLEQTGTIPKPGHKLDFNTIHLEVIEASAKRISKIKLIKERE